LLFFYFIVLVSAQISNYSIFSEIDLNLGEEVWIMNQTTADSLDVLDVLDNNESSNENQIHNINISNFNIKIEQDVQNTIEVKNTEGVLRAEIAIMRHLDEFKLNDLVSKIISFKEYSYNSILNNYVKEASQLALKFELRDSLNMLRNLFEALSVYDEFKLFFKQQENYESLENFLTMIDIHIEGRQLKEALELYKNSLENFILIYEN
jgi:hypothetical protein